MKRTLLAITASLGLAVGAVGATGTAVNAHPSVHVGIGFGFGYGYGGYPYGTYPYNYYPNYYYPYEYYTPHVPHYYPYYYPFNNNHSSYLVCNTIITTRVYWRHHRKYSVQVPVRSCYRAYGY
jgi:hypothetical protein